MASNLVHPVEMRKEHFARSLASILLHGSRILPQCTMQRNETRDVVLADGRVVAGTLLRVSSMAAAGSIMMRTTVFVDSLRVCALRIARRGRDATLACRCMTRLPWAPRRW